MYNIENTCICYQSVYQFEGSNNTVLGAYKGPSSETALNDTVIIAAGITERARCDENGDWDLIGNVSAAGESVVTSNDVTKIVSLTQSEYDALSTVVPTTLYLIV